MAESTTKTIPAADPAAEQMVNGAKFVGNLMLPGIGQIVEGSMGKGVIYGATGIAAVALIGPLGWIVTGLDSYSVSSSGKHLWELFGSAEKPSSVQT